MRLVSLLLLILAMAAPAAGQGIALQMLDPAPTGRRIVEPGLVGNWYPAGPKAPALLLLGGSEGGLGSEMTRLARGLHGAGYSVLHLAWWRAPGTPPALEAVPVEDFDRALDWLKRQPETDRTRLGIVGWSRGSEAAQLLAARRRDVRALVLGMPSAVLWQGIDYAKEAESGSAWTVGGKALPFLPAGAMHFMADPGAPANVAALEQAIAARPEVRTPPLRTPSLLICGEADRVWASCAMARMLAGAARTRTDVELSAHDDAGHFAFGPPLAADDPAGRALPYLGGSSAGNGAALTAGWARMQAFLGRRLAQSSP